MSTITAAQFKERLIEDQMLTTVTEKVKVLGGRIFHLRDARQAPELEDLPDWIVILPPRVFMIEAKSQKRRVTVGQATVLSLLAGCDRFESGIVRPVPHAGEIAFDDFLNWIGGQ